MKGGVVAALHALAAAARRRRAGRGRRAGGRRPRRTAASGTFAALERDDRFDAALIPEPTRSAVACAQAGALTFTGVVPGVSAHAAVRLEGVSAIDRYVEVHRALAEHERAVNAGRRRPADGRAPLPYPLLVGRVEGGRWSSQVPDRLDVRGPPRRARRRDGRARRAAAFEAAVRAACPEAEIAWTGGQFAPGATPPDHPFVRARPRRRGRRARAPRRRSSASPTAATCGCSCARGIPCVMFGPPGLELAHAVDERVAVDDLAALARVDRARAAR